MSIKKYLILCEPCGYKRITDGSDDEDLVKIPRSDIPGGAPFIDTTEKKVKFKKSSKQPIMVKCPKCGRGIRIRKLDQKNENKKNKFT